MCLDEFRSYLIIIIFKCIAVFMIDILLQVFKTTLAEFKNREKYVRGDFRLANEFKKQNPRKIMRMWAEKEMMNLKRMKKFGIACPEVGFVSFVSVIQCEFAVNRLLILFAFCVDLVESIVMCIQLKI